MRCHHTCLAIYIAVFAAGPLFPHMAHCAAPNAKSDESIDRSGGQRTSPRQKPPTASALRRLAMEPIKDNPKLPRVLLIGDSIAMGYTLPLRELLKDKANVHYPTENCHTSQHILERLDTYLGGQPWDVIHFNCGIHDLTIKDETGHAVKAGQQGRIAVPLDEYRENLEKIVARLRQTGATLIWCSSTPVADGLPHRKLADIARYNAVAKEVMQRHQIRTTDLHGAVLRHGKPKLIDGGHFTIDGCREMALDVAPPIAAALAKRPAKNR